ncbi:MAG: hypothetical protein MK033_04275 [Candidatus Caenarcaniphilales bacterium]|nr:hypothetical protein [Candidatus Caenarcaniphilales bacterium]
MVATDESGDFISIETSEVDNLKFQDKFEEILRNGEVQAFDAYLIKNKISDDDLEKIFAKAYLNAADNKERLLKLQSIATTLF